MSAADTSALSSPDAAQTEGLNGPPPTTQAPSGATPAASPAPAGPSKPSLWQNILMGALTGMAGSAGQKNFGGGAAAGAGGFLHHQQEQKENAIQQQKADAQTQEAQSTIKFQSAQAANSVAEASKNNAIAASLPTEARDAHDKNSVAMLGALQGLGLSPVVSADDTHEGAKGALEALTNSQGAVPHLFNVEVGGQHFAYDLNQISQTPQGLSLINQARNIQGQTPLTAAQWKQTPPAAQSQAAEGALSFLNPAPSKNATEATGKLEQYKAFQQAYSKNPNADPDSLKKLNDTVKNLQTMKDSLMDTETTLAKTKAQVAGDQALKTNQGKIDQANAQTPQWLPKVGADEKKKAELAENIAENSNQLAQVFHSRPDMFGPAAGRFTTVEQMVGNNDPDIAKVGTLIHNIAMANSGVHGFRSQEGVKETEQLLLNHFKNGVQSMSSALVGLTKSTQTFIDNARPEGYKTHSKMGGALRGMTN